MEGGTIVGEGAAQGTTERAEHTCPHCGEPVERWQMVCAACGEALDDELARDAELSEELAASSSLAWSEVTRKLLLYTALIALIVVFVATHIYNLLVKAFGPA